MNTIYGIFSKITIYCIKVVLVQYICSSVTISQLSRILITQKTTGKLREINIKCILMFFYLLRFLNVDFKFFQLFLQWPVNDWERTSVYDFKNIFCYRS